VLDAVAGGYAAVATDNGHTSTSGFDGSWSLGHPVRLVDFGYRAQHEATMAGKAVTRAYYGRDADFSYFVGCSQGGHHALMEAQRYPEDYDGIVAGAPANYWIGLMTAELWAGLATTRDPEQNRPRAKLPVLGAAVMAACDGLDGLEDAYEPGRLMGAYAEDTAQHYQFTREAQDDFAITSLKRARAANEDGSFDRETEPVTVRTRKGEVTIAQDEQPFNADLGKIPKLRPAFRKDGTVTPANSSSISDGASALVLTTQSEAEKRGLTPRARIAAGSVDRRSRSWTSTPWTAARALALRQVDRLAGISGAGDGVDHADGREVIAAGKLGVNAFVDLAGEHVGDLFLRRHAAGRRIGGDGFDLSAALHEQRVIGPEA